MTTPTPSTQLPATADEMEGAKVYDLRTLRDIYNLPTYEHIERCLEEVKIVMLQGRAMNDAIAGLIEHNGKTPPPDGRVFEWPEVLRWFDDGKRELGTKYIGPEGKEVMSVTIKKKSQ